MKKVNSLFLLIFFFSVAIFALPVKKIEVHGLKSIDIKFFKSVCSLKEGNEFSLIKLRKDIKNLYELGYFDNIEVKIEDSKDGVILLYNVKERPYIKSISFVGNKKFSDDTFFADIPFLTEDVPFDEKIVHDTIYKIKKKYFEKGYTNVKITPIVKKEEGGVALTFKIDEGKKIKIDRIIFSGLKTVSSKKLKKVMKTKESHWWKRSFLDRDKLDADMPLIEKKMWELGYFGAKVLGYKIKMNTDKTKMDIIITIKEGKRYILADYIIEGNKIFKKDEIKDFVTLKKGEYFTGKEWQKTVKNLTELYGNKSYIFARFEPIYKFKKDKLYLTISIYEGTKIKIGNIYIKGNTKTYDKVILRNLLLKPGDEFNRELLMLSQRQIYNLGYFEDVQVLPSPNKDNENVLDLTIVVKEGRTGSINFGGTYSAYSGLAMFLKYNEKNIMGRGYSGHIQAELGKKVHNYQIGFTNPFLFDTPTYLSFNIYNKYNDYEDYKIYRNGGNITFGRKLALFTTGYVSYKLEKVKVGDVSEQAQYDIEGKTELRSSMSLTFVRDTIDNKMEPSRGTKNSFTAELGGTFLGGDVDYQKYEASTNWFFPSFWKFVFSTYMKTGIVERIAPTKEVPVYERFFVGGTTYGVRGYDDKELSPRDENGYYAGGNYYFTASLAYKAPLVERTLTAYAFWDMGRAWRTLGDFNLQDLRDSVGIGVKIMTPMGPLTLDYAYGFAKKSWKLEFNMFNGTF